MNFKGILSPLLPFITAALSMGGPLGAAAGQELSKILCNKPNATNDELATAYLAATPDQIAAAKKVEEDFRLKMATLNIQDVETMTKLYMDDRANARDMYTKIKGYTQPILAYTSVIGFFTIIALLIFHPFPPETKDALLILLGALISTYKDVYGFFFGSSQGSEDKTAILAGKN